MLCSCSKPNKGRRWDCREDDKVARCFIIDDTPLAVGVVDDEEIGLPSVTVELVFGG